MGKKQQSAGLPEPDPFQSSGYAGVVSTKLNKPAVPTNYVSRTSLFERFEKNLHLPLTLVSAATGSGKSTTVSQWLDSKNYQYGWLSIDTEHNDVQVMIAYLIAILKKIWPAKTFGLENLLNGINVPPNAIISALINDIALLDDRFILVLDDYHLIDNEKIHEIFNGLLRHPPENFHLVIITQVDPPLRLASLRAKFQLNELRMKDFSFSIGEALELRSLIAEEADNKQVETLVQKSEGWITGITIGLMGIAEGIRFEKVLEALYSRNSIIAELLDEAVLNGLPVETQKYLELISLTEQFSEDLISSMVAAIDDKDLKKVRVEDLIRTSRKRNLFLIPLDRNGEWFRFHHLFQSQIRKRKKKHFNADTASLLYKAASGWFEEKGLLEEALTFALRSGDMDFAICLYSRFRHQLLNGEQLQRLYRLTNQFPEDVRNNNPELLINLAMLQHYNANFSRMQQYLSRAKDLLNGLSKPDEHEKHLLGEYHGVSTYLSYMLGDFERAIDHGEKCMESLPADTPNFFREQSVGWYAFAQQACGHASAGINRLEREYQTLANVKHYFKMRLLQGKLIFYLFEGNTTYLYHDGASLANLCSPNKFPGSWLIGIYSMAYHSYMYSQLEKVSGFHDELRLHRYAGRPFWVMHHFFIECLSAMAEALWQKAEHCIAECEELAEELAIEPLKGMVKAFQVEYYLRRNEVDRAWEASALANFEPQPPSFFYYIPQLTQVKLLFQLKQEKKGQELLQDLLEMGRSHHNKNLLIQGLVLQAVIHYRHERNGQARSVLHEALKIAEPTRFLRPFLDHGPAMHHLLRDIAEDQPENMQVIELLQAFDADQNSATKGDPTERRSKNKELNALSKREIEILDLVMQGFKNKEIAEKLFISLTTVKQHLYRAFQKLEVNNRVSAIKRVKELDLFAAD